MLVSKDEENLKAEIPPGHFYHEVFKAAEKRRWRPVEKVWVFPPILSVMEFVRKNMPHLNWIDEAENVYLSAKEKEAQRQRLAKGLVDTTDQLTDTPFKFPPYDHQRKALILGRNTEAFAYFMDQGTGKTKVILDDAAHNFRLGKINGLLVISPNSVKTNWVDPDGGQDEVSTHMAPDVHYVAAAYFASSNKKYQSQLSQFKKSYESGSYKLHILIVNIEGLSQSTCELYVKKFVNLRRCMIVVDESTRIGNRTATRTKVATSIRKYCKLARIATGTPIIKSPLKAYSQLNFLDVNILNQPSYVAFAARYSVTRKQMDPSITDNFDHVLHYVNTDELAEKIAGCSYRVTKEQCLDLPPKVYMPKRVLELEGEQERVYDQMKKESLAFLDGRVLDAPTVLSQLVRLQQITAGYLPVLDEFTREQIGIKKIGSGYSKKIKEVLSILEDSDEKAIVWCKFKFEIEEMSAALSEAGIDHVTFYGKTSDSDRVSNRNAFQNDPGVRVFVGQVKTGGIGITLTAATMVIYLSNTFSTEDRIQSEDRAHRIGQTKSVSYYDISFKRTVDERIISVLRQNKMISDAIMQDGYRSWI